MKTLYIVLIGLFLVGCGPSPAESTATAVMAQAQTQTAVPTPTVTPTPTPFFKRVSINEYMPDMIVSLPLTFEVPANYELVTPDDYSLKYYAMSSENAEVFRKTQLRPKDSAFIEMKFSQGVGYDAHTNQFINVPNDIKDKALVQEYISQLQGAKINNIERINIGEYPALILETEIPFSNTDKTLTRKIKLVYIATLVETNVVLLYYYFPLPPVSVENDIAWEHFKNSFERTPGGAAAPLVPFTPAPMPVP